VATAGDVQWLQVQRDADGAFVDSLTRMGDETRQIVQRYGQIPPVSDDDETGTVPAPVIPDTRTKRDELKADLWQSVVKPYFIGPGDAPLDGGAPLSPYTTLLVGEIEKSVQWAVDQNAAFLAKTVTDPVVLNWITSPGRLDGIPPGDGDRQPWYDPYHLFVHPETPYRLSDNVWRTAEDVRSRIDLLLDYHISRGTAAVDIAEELVRFLQPGEVPILTRTPYGVEGNYSARRLARTEVTAAGGRAFVNAALANPWVEGIKWSRTAGGAACPICDPHANGGPNGDGVYEVRSVPLYPGHPHCMCTLSPVVVQDVAAVTARLRAEIEAGSAEAERYRGIFNSDWLLRALLAGWLVYQGIRDETENRSN